MKEGALHELPGGWVWTRLGEVCLYPQYGWTTSAKTEGALYLLRTTDITSGNIDWNTVPFCKEEPSEKEKYLLKDGDILISRAGSVGYSHLIKNPKKAIFASYLIRFRPLIDEKYFAYFLKSPIYWISISEKSLGIAIPNVNASKLKQISIPLPPLPEQRAIVSKIEQLFSDLDNGIENFKKAQVQLKLYRQSVLKAACEGKLVPTEAELARAQGRDYEAADVLLARILKERGEKWNGKGKYKEAVAPDTSGLPIPDGWIWARLDSLAVLKGGITKDESRKVDNGRKIPYLRVANVQRGYLDLSEIKEIEAQESVISELLLKPGDILFNEGGDRDKLGRGCIWNGEIEECIHQNHVFRARIYSTDISNKIISWFGNSFGQTYFMKQGKQTTNLASINLTKLSAFPVPLPPLAEQRRIVAEVERRLSVSDKTEATITDSLQKAEALRQSILKKAFEGKLLNKKELEKARNAPDWEPAQMLLERIKAEKVKAQKNTRRSKE